MNNCLFNFIYKTTNLVNGKIYVGQHSTNRIKDGYLGSGIALRNAIKQYSKKGFSREIIEFVEEYELDKLEALWIKNLDSSNPLIGYNILKASVCTHLRGEDHPNYGKSFSIETRQKMSESKKGSKCYNFGRTGVLNPNFGTKRSDVIKQKISNSMRGEKSVHFGKIKSAEHKRKRLESFLSRERTLEDKQAHSERTKNYPHITCPHCLKSGDVRNMTRWHFDKCKYKKDYVY